VDEGGCGHFYGHAERSEEIARVRMRALRLDNATADSVARVVRDHRHRLEPETMLRWLRRLGERQLRLLIDVKRGDLAAHTEEVADRGLALMARCEAQLDALIEQQACFSLRDLAVNGDDLKDLGFEQGREIGRVLTLLIVAVVEGTRKNDRGELLAAAASELSRGRLR
jgi:tRNA nucleotidyltransferase (CCA-adding enzyme)